MTTIIALLIGTLADLQRTTNMIKYILACLAIYFSLLIAVSCSKKITNPKTSYNEKAINISVLPLTYTT